MRENLYLVWGRKEENLRITADINERKTLDEKVLKRTKVILRNVVNK